MRPLTWCCSFLCAVIAGAATAERLLTEQVVYLGHFSPPPDQGGGDAGSWSWGTGGLTYIEDCMGQADPSPDDGYPGCIGAFGHVQHFRFGVFDFVPPGSQAQQVVPFYELGAPIAEQQIGRDLKRYYDVLYDRGASHCRLWWTYGDWYVEIADDPPFLGASGCSPGSPSPEGLWDFGAELPGDIQGDPFHSAKMYQGLSAIPQDVADRLFDGKSMMLGISRRSGTHGGSQGPSLYVRNRAVPAEPAPGPVMDATPLVWYELTGFVEWYDEPQMDGPVVHWWTLARAFGAEFVRVGEQEAVVLPWHEPLINPLDYPCSDPTAYRDGDPTTPDSCTVPVCWYGVASCREGPPAHQQPSFWEDTSDGVPMPVDCNISDSCEESTGMHCQSMRPYLLLYDVEELAAVYRGEQSHRYPQPYAKLALEDVWVDGYGCGSQSSGSTFDHSRRLLFVSQGGASPVIHVLSVQQLHPLFSDDFESGGLSRWAGAISKRRERT